MPAKSSVIIIGLLCVAIFSWSVYRDVHANKQFVGDLRNRIVGARMEKDGLSPYFYKWKKGDGLRYYDPGNFDSLRVSNITASPFFHHLLYPIAEWPQIRINDFWLIAEYTMLAIIVLLSLSFCNTVLQKWLVVGGATFFLLTEGWKMHIGNGQNYICIVLLAMLFYYCIRKKSNAMAIAAGLCAVTLVLIKPNTVLFFVPFLFVAKQYTRNWLFLFLIPIAVVLIFTIARSNERYLWTQYQQNITQQIKVHQGEGPVLQVNEPRPQIAEWEGISMKVIDRQAALHPQHIYSENGNVFVVVQQVLHKKLGKKILFISSFVCVLLLLALFYARRPAGGFSLPAVALVGFCLFMISDLFSPVYRHQYYTVQWLFPLCLSAAIYHRRQQKIYWLIAAGLLLSIVNIDFIPMEHTMGEYIMLLAFIVLSLRRQTGISK